MLTKRFQDRAEPDATEPAPAAAPTAPAAPPPAEKATTASPAASRSSTRTPDGMTRRTYYVAKDTAAALDAAVDQVVAATGGLITKHQALGAILSAGIDQVDQVAKDVRAELLNNLGPLPNS